MSTKYIASNWRLPNQAGVDSYLNDNYGLTFDGSSEYIDLGTDSQIQFNTTFSISCWVKTSNTSQNKFIIHRGVHYSETFQDYRLLITSSGNAQLRVNNNSYSVTSTETNLDDGNWHHIVAICDLENTDGHIYVDNGTPATNTSFPSSLNLNTGYSSYISSPGGSFDMIGNISEVAVFDYALSSTQVSTLYGSSSLGAGNPLALKPAPVAFYPLGDNSSGNPLTQPNEAVEDASVFNFDSSSNSFIQANNVNLDSANKFTVSLWLKVTSDSFEEFFSIYTGSSMNFFIGRRAGNRLDIYFGSFIYQSSVLNTNSFDNIIVVFDGTQASNTDKIKCFVNGDQISLSGSTSNTSLPSGSKIIYLGRRGSTYLDGELSNVAIWNSDQSSEISNIYNSGVPATTYTNTPTAWYKLDQSANWEADSSGAWQIPDAVSAYPQSFDFSGTNQNINLGNDASLYPGTSDMSYSFWFKSNSLSSYKTIFSQGATDLNALSTGNKAVFITTLGDELRVFVGFGQSGSWAIDNGGAFNTSNANFVADKWYNIVFTFDRDGDGVIYVNGVANVTQAVNGSSTSVDIVSNDNTIIGGVAYDFDGQISNFQIFNTALPATGSNSVETLYNNGVPLTTAIASDNLKGWYKLDNTATFSANWSIPDASGNGNTGTSSGMTEQNLVNNNVSALNGESSGMTSANLVLTDLTRNLPYDSYSFNFDGVNDYIDCGNDSSLEITTNFTISAWVNLNTMTGYRRIIGKANSDNSKANYGLGLFQGYKPGVIANATGSWFTNYSANALSTGVWHHLVGIYDGSNFILYVNGTLDNSTSVSGFNIATAASATSGDSLLIGQIPSGAENFNGKISNVSLFNEALTSTEVMKLYLNGMPQDLSTFTPAPIAWWTLGSNSFFNGTNFICKDLTGSNDGTSANAGVDALQGNTPRSEANGTGTNMDIPTNLEGTTKYSSNNSWSINMSESARVADTP